MTFEKRIAKIGKGINTNLYAKNNNEISVILYANGLIEKTLNTSNEKYSLELVGEKRVGVEAIWIDDKHLLSRTRNNIWLESVK